MNAVKNDRTEPLLLVVEKENDVSTDHSPPAKTGKWATFFLYTHLALFGLVGCYIRMRLENNWDTFASEKELKAETMILFEDLPINMLGCFIIGMLMAPREEGNTKEYVLFPSTWTMFQENPALTKGLRTGLCGALTTYATWNQDMTELMLNGPQKHGLLASIIYTVFSYLIGTILSFAMVAMGEYFAIYVEEQINKRTTKLLGEGQTSHTVQRNKSVFPFQVFISVVFFATYAFIFYQIMTNPGAFQAQDDVSDGKEWAGMLMAPFGVFLRAYLGKKFNGKYKYFFYGTFLANLLACALDGVLYGLLVAFEDPKYPNTSIDTKRKYMTSGLLFTTLTTAFTSGFAGSLSTVSTFMTELWKLNRQRKGQIPKAMFQYLLATIVSTAIVSYAFNVAFRDVDLYDTYYA